MTLIELGECGPLIRLCPCAGRQGSGCLPLLLLLLPLETVGTLLALGPRLDFATGKRCCFLRQTSWGPRPKSSEGGRSSQVHTPVSLTAALLTVVNARRFRLRRNVCPAFVSVCPCSSETLLQTGKGQTSPPPRSSGPEGTQAPLAWPSQGHQVYPGLSAALPVLSFPCSLCLVLPQVPTVLSAPAICQMAPHLL